MSEQPTFEQILTEANQRWEAGTPEDIQIAYDLITEAAPRFMDDMRNGYLLYNYRYCGAALLGKTDLAIKILREAGEAGFWWSEEYLRSDADLKSLQDLPAFNQIIEEFGKKRQAALSKSKPDSITLPLPAKTAEAYPLLLALHGNTLNAKVSVESWQSAVEDGWLTALLQSSQMVFTDAFVWDDLELGGKELKDHFAEISAKYPIDSEKVVLGGFSKGGEMVIWAALMEILPARGFIAVNPGGPLILDTNRWLPLVANCKRFSEMRGFFIVGENDPNFENIKAVRSLLESHGMTCELVVAPDIAHAFPEDFGQILTRALKFLC